MLNCPKCGSSNVQIVNQEIKEKLTAQQQETLRTQKAVKLSPDQWNLILEFLLKLLQFIKDILNSSKEEAKEQYICCNDCHTISKL